MNLKNIFELTIYLFFLLTFCKALRIYKHKWNTYYKSLVGITDVKWSYCDIKCVYFEKRHPLKDFVVLTFIEIQKPNQQFAQCYINEPDGSYRIWNKVIINNFYEKNCGTKDYLTQGYHVIKIEGEKIGTQINY